MDDYSVQFLQGKRKKCAFQTCDIKEQEIEYFWGANDQEVSHGSWVLSYASETQREFRIMQEQTPHMEV